MEDTALKLMQQSRKALQIKLEKTILAAAEARKKYAVKQADALDIRRQLQHVDAAIANMNGQGPDKGFTDDRIFDELHQILADGPMTTTDLEAEIAIRGLPMTRTKAVLKARVEFGRQGGMFILRSSLYPESVSTE